MNVRKPVDYGTMYLELTAILAQNLPQMDEIHVIGKAISQRPEKGAAVCLRKLIQRFDEGGEFPHEVGLFLGYPPEDVRGFIEHKYCGCKCVGSWKVYGDAQKAQEAFSRFDKFTRIYCEQWAQGKSIERLTVAG